MPGRNANNAGSIRKRKDGTWEGRYSAGRNPVTGAYIRRSVYGNTQAEVRKKLTMLTNDLDKGTYTAPSRMTFGAWCKVWLEEYCVGVKPSTLSAYESKCRLYFAPALGNVHLQEVTAPMVQALYNSMQEKGLSSKTLSLMHGVLHECFSTALQVGYIALNPCERVKVPRAKKKEIHPFERSQIAPFLSAAKDDPYYNVFRIALFTGCRQAELLGLTWDCIDWKNKKMTVKGQLQHSYEKGKYAEVSLQPTKTDKWRTFAVADEVMTILQAIRKQQAADCLRMGNLYSNPMNLVFCDAFGKHISSRTLYKHFKKIAASIDCPDMRFHDLRHTYATLRLENGDNIKQVSAALGHATTAFTMDVYSHVTATMEQESMDKMQTFINSISG